MCRPWRARNERRNIGLAGIGCRVRFARSYASVRSLGPRSGSRLTMRERAALYERGNSCGPIGRETAPTAPVRERGRERNDRRERRKKKRLPPGVPGLRLPKTDDYLGILLCIASSAATSSLLLRCSRNSLMPLENTYPMQTSRLCKDKTEQHTWEMELKKSSWPSMASTTFPILRWFCWVRIDFSDAAYNGYKNRDGVWSTHTFVFAA